jgi:hypothetical protein
MAYWQIQKTADPSRWYQSRPATIRDLYDILLTSKGKQPRGLFDQKQTTIDATTRKHWSETTGSTQKSISWWTG